MVGGGGAGAGTAGSVQGGGVLPASTGAFGSNGAFDGSIPSQSSVDWSQAGQGAIGAMGAMGNQPQSQTRQQAPLFRAAGGTANTGLLDAYQQPSYLQGNGLLDMSQFNLGV
jgi:hypothetical protein